MTPPHLVRWISYFGGAWLLLSSLLSASADPLADPGMDFWRWTVTQGGLVVAFLFVLWSYRKDFKSERQGDKDQIAVLVQLVEKATTAMTSLQASHTALSSAFDRVATQLDVDRRVGERERRHHD